MKGLYPAICYVIIELHRRRNGKEFSIVVVQDYFGPEEQHIEMDNFEREREG
jgi:hypothetical protein